MPRPRILRRIAFQPDLTYFRPRGIARPLDIILNYEELEALRLVDLNNLEQEEAAKQMKISQPTFSRLLKEARRKVASALVEGRAINIHGGNFQIAFGMQGRGRRGMRSMKGRSRPTVCICPNCGYKIQHQIGIPCYQQKCPKCDSPMIRER